MQDPLEQWAEKFRFKLGTIVSDSRIVVRLIQYLSRSCEVDTCNDSISLCLILPSRYCGVDACNDFLFISYFILFSLLFHCLLILQVYPIWMCPHRIYKLPVKPQIYPEPGFELHRRQGDTQYAQMYTDIGIYYAPGPILRGEAFDGAEAVRKMENWLIENNGFQPQYAVSELSEKNFWRMFDAELYEQARKKYGAVGTFMSVYYKCKKGRKTEKEVQEAEQAHLETAYAEVDQPMD